MERNVGTISRGIRCPIIREGDDLAGIVVNSVLKAGETDGFELRDRDIVCVTESVVARSQGNYASVDAIAADVKRNWAERPSALSSPSFPETASPSACAVLRKAPGKSS